ncbi:hypothetical protein B0A50_05185 [Salinomyces thailandicus]|uniref:Uncharacterized protein n=1 Tax=Salinomyces thailandicus TaxID=706561 RepID=A0A4U0TXC8_9PEZI|nr:hypothetical protein B0A50_05185 [Salinomyces thailandica]
MSSLSEILLLTVFAGTVIAGPLRRYANTTAETEASMSISTVAILNATPSSQNAAVKYAGPSTAKPSSTVEAPPTLSDTALLHTAASTSSGSAQALWAPSHTSFSFSYDPSPTTATSTSSSSVTKRTSSATHDLPAQQDFVTSSIFATTSKTATSTAVYQPTTFRYSPQPTNDTAALTTLAVDSAKATASIRDTTTLTLYTTVPIPIASSPLSTPRPLSLTTSERTIESSGAASSPTTAGLGRDSTSSSLCTTMPELSTGDGPYKSTWFTYSAATASASLSTSKITDPYHVQSSPSPVTSTHHTTAADTDSAPASGPSTPESSPTPSSSSHAYISPTTPSPMDSSSTAEPSHTRQNHPPADSHPPTQTAASATSAPTTSTPSPAHTTTATEHHSTAAGHQQSTCGLPESITEKSNHPLNSVAASPATSTSASAKAGITIVPVNPDAVATVTVTTTETDAGVTTTATVVGRETVAIKG